MAIPLSFYGVIDLLAILPSYINLFTSANYVMVVRVLRLLRVFRVLKLAHFLEETDTLVTALRASRRKIMVFVFTVVAVVIVMGTLMYLIEGEANGFTSIPQSIYWAIVTLTTVGYGDITPHTPIGQLIASLIMVMCYGIIAVPTGIFSMELRHATKARMRESAPIARPSNQIAPRALPALRKAVCELDLRRWRLPESHFVASGEADCAGVLLQLRLRDCAIQSRIQHRHSGADIDCPKKPAATSRERIRMQP